MTIIISGSIAYDRIMDFPGRFRDHIMPDKIHILNVCFTIKQLEERFGGTGANIAYNLRLLGLKLQLTGAVGSDADPYLKYFRNLKINYQPILKVKKTQTASAYIITDKDDNQISAFHPGAMNEEIRAFQRFCRSKFFSSINNKDKSIAIIAPSSKAGMLFLSQEYKRRKIPYIFDPGQALTLFNKRELLSCIRGSKILIGNDYEISLIKKKIGTARELSLLSEILITTYGAQGSVIKTKNQTLKIPAYIIKNPLDPTGAGDAYRSGLLKGLSEGHSLKECGLLGSVCASFAVEKYGTQEHKFSVSEFEKRYKEIV